jgi:hypothetical protein
LHHRAALIHHPAHFIHHPHSVSAHHAAPAPRPIIEPCNPWESSA